MWARQKSVFCLSLLLSCSAHLSPASLALHPGKKASTREKVYETAKGNEALECKCVVLCGGGGKEERRLSGRWT